MLDDFLEISQFYDDDVNYVKVYDKSKKDNANDLFYVVSITISYVAFILLVIKLLEFIN